MMTSHFNKLLQRYLDKTASGQERSEFFRLVRSGEHDQELDSSFLKLLHSEMKKPVAPGEKAALERVFNKMMGNEAPVETPEPHTPIRRHWWLAAAAVMLMTVVAWVWMIRQRVNADRMIIAGPEYVHLPDGSTVLLNAGSTLQYSKASYGWDFREVILEGEAYFDIRHNSSAFLVHAGGVTTTVLGTAFNVNAFPGKDQVAVTVVRGKVEVADENETFSQVMPDQRIVVNATTGEFTKTNGDANAALAWMNKYFVLDRVTVEEAARLIGIKYNVKVTVASEALKHCTLSARFFREESLREVLDVVSVPLKATYTIGNGHVSIDGDGSNCK